jgi:RNA polymerase sigma-70 factor (sigma-E family)
MPRSADAPDEFQLLFERHHSELSRFAYLLCGDPDTADDLAADAFAVAWSKWEQVRAKASPLAYLRGIVSNLASNRIRRLIRERRRLPVLGAEDRADSPDVLAVVDVRAALLRLPMGKRACVVLRYAFDLSEEDTAEALGISVGTVKSQTSRGVAELVKVLGPARVQGVGPRPNESTTRRGQ